MVWLKANGQGQNIEASSPGIGGEVRVSSTLIRRAHEVPQADKKGRNRTKELHREICRPFSYDII